MIQSFSQSEPNLVSGPIDISPDTSLSLPETLSLPSKPSVAGQIPTNFPTIFSSQSTDRYRELQSTNTPLRLDWNSFVAHPPICGQHLDSNRLHNWALNRLQYRHDIHKDIK